MGRKPDKHRISSEAVDDIVRELERWAQGAHGSGLSWDVISRYAGFSRQSLSSHAEILSAYQAAKKALRTGARATTVGRRTRERMEDRFLELQKEVERYRKLEAGWLERWIRIAYYAQSHGLSIEQLDKPIPQNGRR